MRMYLSAFYLRICIAAEKGSAICVRIIHPSYRTLRGALKVIWIHYFNKFPMKPFHLAAFSQKHHENHEFRVAKIPSIQYPDKMWRNLYQQSLNSKNLPRFVGRPIPSCYFLLGFSFLTAPRFQDIKMHQHLTKSKKLQRANAWAPMNTWETTCTNAPTKSNNNATLVCFEDDRFK